MLTRLRKTVFGHAQWLSGQVGRASKSDKQFRWWARGSRKEAFHRILHRLHSFNSSLTVGASVFVLAVGSSFAWGLAHRDTCPSESLKRLAGLLGTVAEVLAGVAGLLFAVIIFAVQFHAARLGHGAFLVRYLSRREGLVPIASFILATIGAFLFVQLLSTVGIPRAPEAMVPIGSVLIAAAFLLVLWLFYHMVTGIAGDFLSQSVIPGLTYEYSRLLDKEERHIRLLQEFKTALAIRSLSYAPYAGGALFLSTEQYEFPLSRRGTIRDVDLVALGYLAAYVTTTCAGYKAEFAVAPGDTVDTNAAFVLSKRTAIFGQNETPKPSFTIELSELRTTLTTLLDNCFDIAHTSPVADTEVLAEFLEMVRRQARYDDPEQFERGLEVYWQLVSIWHERTGGRDAPWSFFRQRLTPLVGSEDFQLRELVEKTLDSDNREKIELLLRFAARLFSLAIEKHHGQLFRAATHLVDVFYYRLIRTEAHRKWIGLRVDTWLEFVLREVPWEIHEDDCDELMLVRVEALRWCVNLIKLALEGDREDDALDYHMRLLEYDKRSETRLPSNLKYRELSDAQKYLHDLHSYVNIIVAAWCVRRMQSAPEQNQDVALSLYNSALRQAGTQHDLLAVWETIDHGPHLESGVDARLGLSSWDHFPHEERPARRQSVAVNVDRGWLLRGLVTLLLKARPATGQDVAPQLSQPPKREVWITKQIGQLATELVKQPPVALGGEQADKAVEATIALVAERECAYKLEQLRWIVEADLDKDLIKSFGQRVLASIGESRNSLAGLKAAAKVVARATCSVWPRSAHADWLPKAEFVKGGLGVHNAGASLVMNLLKRELIEVENSAAKCAPAGETIEALSALEATIRRARKQLEAMKYRPSILFIPYGPIQLKFIRSLFGCPSDEVEGRHEYGSDHLGTWEGLEVFSWAFTDPDSILIADGTALFGLSELAEGGKFRFKVENKDSMQHQQMLKKAEETNDPDKIARPSDVRVVGIGRLVPALGIRGTRAAIRMPIDLENLGYAILAGDTCYHRPGCHLLEGKKVQYSLSNLLDSGERVRSCLTCRPYEWDRGSD